jgi:predicted Zn-dependent peptidase
MYCRLAHPSKEVLQKARKHVKDFPDFSIPEEVHVCPRCTQGKMTNKSFPPSKSRETVPFTLILKML